MKFFSYKKELEMVTFVWHDSLFFVQYAFANQPRECKIFDFSADFINNISEIQAGIDSNDENEQVFPIRFASNEYEPHFISLAKIMNWISPNMVGSKFPVTYHFKDCSGAN